MTSHEGLCWGCSSAVLSERGIPRGCERVELKKQAVLAARYIEVVDKGRSVPRESICLSRTDIRPAVTDGLAGLPLELRVNLGIV